MRPILLAFLLPLALSPALTSAQVPSPESHFGFTPGEHRRLANWDELTAYYAEVALATDRIVLDTLGTTTRGLPFVMLTITSPENHARLEELRQIHLRLADPRTVASADELARLKEEARTVVLVTSHIHSTEVGAGQMPANLLHRLASSTDPDVLEILDRVILLHIPSLNPDGTQLLSNWYRRNVGTEFEGANPPELYHFYIGHDNNRDWYAFTQRETQLTIEKAHNVWRPMIVHDVHQMSATGARMFVPPYVEPFEANVDPLIIAAINQLGSYMAAEMTTMGLTGVVTSAQYDLFTPARAYQHYHGGVRILSETASARLATPLVLGPGDLDDGRGFQVNRASMNFPAPWPGGEWGLPQIVRYQEAGVMALLKNAARNRTFWVDNFHEVNRRAVGKWPSWPEYWVIPAEQANEVGMRAVLRILTMGSVEVHRSLEPLVAAGRTFAAGSYVIPMRQPYASWAQTMLELQEYPDLRDYPGGPPTRPYDVTAHTLPLLMGIEAVRLEEPLEVVLSGPIETVDVRYPTPAAFAGPDPPRLAIYKGWRETMPAGWTRWVFDQHGLPYDTIHDADVRRGNLRDRYDVILLQDQSPAQLTGGWPAGEMPGEYTGGIGPEGAAALRAFVQAGGRLVAIESASDFAIDLFALPVRNRVDALPTAEFYIPGSILALEIDPSHPITAAADRHGIAWFWRTSRAFDVNDPTVRVLARYRTQEPRLSGWVLGEGYVAGQAALIEARVGSGSVVLFGFQPNYRGQSIATWPLLFDALSAGLQR
ncbi:MAG TPA: M14 family zinc carboxypeptidase [Longimicrobiaceae bacterium]|nr:M14 family zinc carboxypeptidase [Longimicrobiaceae bacterium]